MNLPLGEYIANWLEPVQGTTIDIAPFAHSGGVKAFQVPNGFTKGVALRVVLVP